MECWDALERIREIAANVDAQHETFVEGRIARQHDEALTQILRIASEALDQ